MQLKGNGKIHISGTRDEQQMLIDITDSGKGISRKVHQPGIQAGIYYQKAGLGIRTVAEQAYNRAVSQWATVYKVE